MPTMGSPPFERPTVKAESAARPKNHTSAVIARVCHLGPVHGTVRIEERLENEWQLAKRGLPEGSRS